MSRLLVFLFCCSPLVYAESNLTLYGMIDQGYGYTHQSISGQRDGVDFRYRSDQLGHRSGVKNNNMVGLRAEERLDNGTSVFIQIESEQPAFGHRRDRGTSIIGIGK